MHRQISSMDHFGITMFVACIMVLTQALYDEALDEPVQLSCGMFDSML